MMFNARNVARAVGRSPAPDHRPHTDRPTCSLEPLEPRLMLSASYAFEAPADTEFVRPAGYSNWHQQIYTYARNLTDQPQTPYVSYYLSPDPNVTTDDLRLWRTGLFTLTNGTTIVPNQPGQLIRTAATVNQSVYQDGPLGEAGTHYAAAVIEGTNVWSETLTLHTLDQPRAAVWRPSAVTTPVASARVGERIPVHINVTNIGEVDGRFGGLTFYDDDNVGGFTAWVHGFNEVGPGESAELVGMLEVPHGGDDGIVELYGSRIIDGQRYEYALPPIRVAGVLDEDARPDLVASLDIDAGAAQAGDTVSATVTIRNIGEQTAHRSAFSILRSAGQDFSPAKLTFPPADVFHVASDWDPFRLQSPVLRPGEQAEIETRLYMPAIGGTQYFAAAADTFYNLHTPLTRGSYNQIEANEDNNVSDPVAVAIANPDTPSAGLTHDFVGGYADTAAVNAMGYLEVAFEKTRAGTIDGDELALAGDGADGVALGAPQRVADGVYRYPLRGALSAGPVEARFAAGSFTGASGTPAPAKTESFTSLPNVAPLQFSLAGSEFQWNVATQRFEAAGRIGLGMRPAPGGAFVPLLEIDGTVGFDDRVIGVDGVVSPNLGGIDVPLFSGAFQIDVGTAFTSALNEAAGRLPNEYNLAGVELKLDKMEFVIPAGKSIPETQLELQGKIVLPTDLGNTELSIADPHKLIIAPGGVSLSGGKIDFPDVWIRLFEAITVDASDLSVEYLAATEARQNPPTPAQPDRLRLRGKLSLPDFYDVTANFAADADGNDAYIEISENGVELIGSLGVGNVAIVPGVWEIVQATLGIDTTRKAVQGDATIRIPTGIDLSAGLGFVDGEFNYFRLGAGNLNKPIGVTGAFLQSIAGQVDHVSEKDPAPISFGGDIGMTAGPSLTVPLPDWAGGEFVGTLMELDLSAELDENHIGGHGYLGFVSGLVEANANAELNWQRGYLTGSGSLDALGGLITGEASFRADSAMNVSLAGNGAVTIPEVIPFWGGQKLASANLLVHFTDDDNLANDYAAGWGEVKIEKFGTSFAITTGVRVRFDGSYGYLGAEQIQALSEGGPVSLAGNPPAAAPVAGAPLGADARAMAPLTAEPLNAEAAPAGYVADADSEWILLAAEWADESLQPVRVTAPDGTTYDRAAIDASENLAVLETFSGPGRVGVVVKDPAPGTWQIALPDAPADARYAAYQSDPGPSVTVTSATSKPGGTVEIAYDADAAGDGATVNLYWDDDGVGGDGVLIAAGLDAGPGRYAWDASALSGEPVHIYAMIDDGTNAPVRHYAPEPVAPRQLAEAITLGDGTFTAMKLFTPDGQVLVVKSVGAVTDVYLADTEAVVEARGPVALVSAAATAIEQLSIRQSAGGIVAVKAPSWATLGDVQLDGAQLQALVGRGIVLTGDIAASTDSGVGALVLGGINGPGQQTLSLGTWAAPAKLVLGAVADASIEMGGDFASLIVDAWTDTDGDDRIVARRAGRIVSAGDLPADIALLGGAEAIVAVGTLSGAITAGEPLGKVVTKGAFTGSVTAPSLMKLVAVGHIYGTVDAGVLGVVAGKADIAAGAAIRGDAAAKIVAAGQLAGLVDVDRLGAVVAKGDLPGTIRSQAATKIVAGRHMTGQVTAGALDALVVGGHATGAAVHVGTGGLGVCKVAGSADGMELLSAGRIDVVKVTTLRHATVLAGVPTAGVLPTVTNDTIDLGVARLGKLIITGTGVPAGSFAVDDALIGAHQVDVLVANYPNADQPTAPIRLAIGTLGVLTGTAADGSRYRYTADDWPDLQVGADPTGEELGEGVELLRIV